MAGAETRRAASSRIAFFLVLSIAIHVAVMSVLQGAKSGTRHRQAEPLIVRVMNVDKTSPSAAQGSNVEPQVNVPAGVNAIPGPKKKIRTSTTDHQSVPETSQFASAKTVALDVEQQNLDEERATLGVFDEAQYLPVTSLDRFPRLSAAIATDVSANLPVDAVDGFARVSLWIDEHGSVTKAEVIEAHPEGVFDEAILDAYRNAQFHPGERDGVPVKSALVIEIDLTARSDAVQPMAEH